jgi:hypothetical protein
MGIRREKNQDEMKLQGSKKDAFRQEIADARDGEGEPEGTQVHMVLFVEVMSHGIFSTDVVQRKKSQFHTSLLLGNMKLQLNGRYTN